jgi:hypothetical protein
MTQRLGSFLFGSLIVVFGSWLGACTGDDGGTGSDAGASGAAGESEAGSGGHGGTGGGHAGTSGGNAGTSGGSGTGGSGSGGSGSCDASGMDLLANQDHELSGLSLGNGRLAFLAADLTLASPATIDTIKTDGTGRVTLYSPMDQRRVHQLLASGDTVYFLEVNNADVVPEEALFSVPLAGGTPMQLGTGKFPGARFVGIDDTNLYLAQNTDQPVGVIFQRVELASGDVTKAATLTDVGTAVHLQLSGDDIFFVASGAGADAGMVSAYSFPKNGSNVTPTKLWTEDAMRDSCNLSLGGLVATPTKVACGLFGVETRSRTGTSANAIIAEDLTNRAYAVVASSGEDLYLMTPPTTNDGVGHLDRIESSGGDITPIACDVHTLENHLADGTFPVQNEFEAFVGGDQLYWIEKHAPASGDASWFIRHAPK